MSSTTIRVGGRRAWLGATALIAVLGSVEIAAVALLGHRFLPDVLAWCLDVLGFAMLVAAGVAVASVTWRRHEVNESRARLVLGYLGEIRIPRDDITEVVVLPALMPMESHMVGPTYVDGVLNLVAAQGITRVRITLAEARRGRRLWQCRGVTMIEVSDADDLLFSALMVD